MWRSGCGGVLEELVSVEGWPLKGVQSGRVRCVVQFVPTVLAAIILRAWTVTVPDLTLISNARVAVTHLALAVLETVCRVSLLSIPLRTLQAIFIRHGWPGGIWEVEPATSRVPRFVLVKWGNGAGQAEGAVVAVPVVVVEWPRMDEAIEPSSRWRHHVTLRVLD